MPVGYLYFHFGKCLSIQFFCPFLNQVVFMMLNFMSDLYFHPFSRLPFHFVDGFPCCAKLLILIRSYLLTFVSFTLGDGSKKILLQFTSKNVLPMLSSRKFIISSLAFKSLIYFVYFSIWY